MHSGGALVQPTAFRSDIRDVVKAAFPPFLGVCGRNGPVGVGVREFQGNLTGYLRQPGRVAHSWSCRMPPAKTVVL